MTGVDARALYDKDSFDMDRRLGDDPPEEGSEHDVAVAEIRGAVARGWCAPENAHKEMDSDLAEAITQELVKLAEKWADK